MKITGVSVDTSLEDSPHVHGGYVVYKGHKKVLHAEALRAMCGMPVSALPFHVKFKEDLEQMGLSLVE